MAEVADNAAPGPDVSEIDDRADSQVPWRIFAFIGAFVLVISIIYGATSGEEAGAVMLTVAAILGLWCAVFLWRNLRRYEAGTSGHRGGDHEAMYLPEASPWPFGIGLGLTLVLNGLLIGTWFLVPGVMVLVLSLAGFARQSRHRA
ncbi:cytochrome c oxidase subunit 4 [Aquihabitans sp. G128]|uniref:aa3-type cytochrome oxidase subunit IV n=1 Tax=Aquihabitans sp. G128 TaxID=2849779 RepID=UPI001C24DE1A|nr:cytochrome c oxidase subunit 4 [Aquihabitans sp. G128]QXC61528.1 cytochrome c oxidase subunit 4 [Aquihabitans sp. G128]